MSNTTTTNSNRAPNDWDKRELGVLWKRKKTNGNEHFLTGKINLKSLGFDKEVQIVCFTNKQKTEDKPTYPDLRIYLSEPKKEGATASATAASTSRPVAKAPSAAPANTDSDDGLI